MNDIKRLTGVALATGMFMASMGAQAAFSDQDDRAFGGTMACGGNHFNRMGGTEAHRTTYVFRNYGDTPIRVEQMTMYDANGTVIFSADATSLPLFKNSVLGPGDNVLMPNETAQINSDDLLGDAGLGRNFRPISMKIDWAADSKTTLPDFVWVRTSRGRIQVPDPANPGALFWKTREDRARHLNNCRSISINKGRGQDRDDD
jgi:hypothetical protein